MGNDCIKVLQIILIKLFYIYKYKIWFSQWHSKVWWLNLYTIYCLNHSKLCEYNLPDLDSVTTSTNFMMINRTLDFRPICKFCPILRVENVLLQTLIQYSQTWFNQKLYYTQMQIHDYIYVNVYAYCICMMGIYGW